MKDYITKYNELKSIRKNKIFLQSRVDIFQDLRKLKLLSKFTSTGMTIKEWESVRR